MHKPLDQCQVFSESAIEKKNSCKGEVQPAARNHLLRACATSRASTPSCEWWRLFAPRGSGAGWAAAVDRRGGCLTG
jgi:hypothetical protein